MATEQEKIINLIISKNRKNIKLAAIINHGLQNKVLDSDVEQALNEDLKNGNMMHDFFAQGEVDLYMKYWHNEVKLLNT